jgi:hypoxanthine phosphoribosyltransferase
MEKQHLSSQPILTQSQIQEKVKSLGETISMMYGSKPLALIPILTGALYFAADLSRCIYPAHTVHPIAAKSYGDYTTQQHEPELTIPSLPPDKHYLIVDTVIDTGSTLKTAIPLLKKHSPLSINAVALVGKLDPTHQLNIKPIVGFTLSNRFIVGYGLDYKQHYRHLKSIYQLETN